MVIKGVTIMEIKNCRKCGRIYNSMGKGNVCPGCQKELEEKFKEVKQYIYDNPHVSFADVTEALDVSAQQIKQWVREERLEFSEASGSGLACEKCGRPVASGRFCPKCKEVMANTFSSAYRLETPASDDKKEKKSSAKMRFLK